MQGDNGEVLVVPETYGFDMNSSSTSAEAIASIAVPLMPPPELRTRRPSPLQTPLPIQRAPVPSALSSPTALPSNLSINTSNTPGSNLAPTLTLPNVPPAALAVAVEPLARASQQAAREATEEAAVQMAEEGPDDDQGVESPTSRHGTGVIRIYPLPC